MVNNCRETFPWGGRFSCLKQRIRAYTARTSRQGRRVLNGWPTSFIWSEYYHYIISTSTISSINCSPTLPTQSWKMTKKSSWNGVSHTKMSRGLGSPHPSPFFLKIIYSVTCRKKKRLLSTRWCYCFCYDVAIWRAGWVTSDPLFWAGKKQTFLSFIVCIQSSLAWGGGHHLLLVVLASPRL